jgi:multidrug efflux pump subunit AcrA (membrane-fusion protein)
MSTTIEFIRKQWLTLLLVAASFIGVSWVVRTQRAPGSMTIIEAQAMDMGAMKPPVGVVPVAAEPAALRSIGGASEYPGTVIALSDEEVVARLPGRITRVFVYPGDRVRAGQLLATLQADEYAAQAGESRYLADARSAMANSAAKLIEAKRSALARAQAGLRASRAMHSRAKADLDTVRAERQMATEELAAADGELAERGAEAEYAEKNLSRMERLHKAGAISLNLTSVTSRSRRRRPVTPSAPLRHRLQPRAPSLRRVKQSCDERNRSARRALRKRLPLARRPSAWRRSPTIGTSGRCPTGSSPSGRRALERS